MGIHERDTEKVNEEQRMRKGITITFCALKESETTKKNMAIFALIL